MTTERFEREATVLERAIDGELVLYLPSTDDVMVLDPPGALVWASIETPVGGAALAEMLAELVARPAEVVLDDIEPLLARLLEGGFLVSDGSSPDSRG